jgi:hypothetical protein
MSFPPALAASKKGNILSGEPGAMYGVAEVHVSDQIWSWMLDMT